jgi:iron complex outermembrane receptor protein
MTSTISRTSIPHRVAAVLGALLSAVPTMALAQASAAGPGDKPQQLEPVVVNADPLDRSALDSLRPVDVLRGDQLRDRESTNLGATLGRELGVQSSAYGPGAGRPIIRGMDSARVRVTESGLGVGDVSGVSPDHRVSADTLNSPQVEVLRGPATLLYGSGAIGGLVNIVSDRVPRVRPDNAGASISLRGSTAEHERAAALDLESPVGRNGALHFEGFTQRTDDYEIAAPLRDADGNVIAAESLPNSQTDTRSFALGGAWFGSNTTRVGAAVQRYESDYGIPNPEEPVTIELRRSRAELNADSGPIGPFAGLRSKFALTDYRHTEFEPGGEAGATFTSRSSEGRIELPLTNVAGFKTVIGTQLAAGDTRGVGEGELPRIDSGSVSLFAIGERRLGDTRVELGARMERAKHDVKEGYEDGSRAPSRGFSLFTASGGAAWLLAPGWELGATLTLSQRAPAVEELYFIGAHPATFAFEIGDPKLRKERSTNLELGLQRKAGPVRGRVNAFVNRVRDYIFGAFDGSTTDLLDEMGNVEETLSNLFFRQADARLHGAEAEVSFGEGNGANGRLWADTVRAKLTSGANAGDNLPRISPSRLGAELGWRGKAWSTRLSITRVFRQDRTSGFDMRDGEPETATPGYTTVDLGASWRVHAAAVPLVLYVQGRNLTDQDIRIHTSFLKSVAPPPGRSLWFGVRAAI